MNKNLWRVIFYIFIIILLILNLQITSLNYEKRAELLSNITVCKALREGEIGTVTTMCGVIAREGYLGTIIYSDPILSDLSSHITSTINNTTNQ